MKWLKRLFCKHHLLTFIRNIHGDEIIYRGWKRSEWKCNECGALVLKDELHRKS